MLPLLVVLALLSPAIGSTGRAGPASCAVGDQQHCCISASRIAQLTNTTSAEECCASCGADPGCGAYCFYSKEGQPTCNHFRAPVGEPYECKGTGECISSQSWHPPPQPPSPPAPPGSKNLLYFMVDDLRTALGSRHPHMALTPHLDRLASEGATFTYAYCNHAVCAPSRDSFMSGLRPGTLQLWTFKGDFRHARAPAGQFWVPHPQHYKDHGYLTLGGGKTYHPGHPADYDQPHSWSQDKAYFPFSEEGCPIVDQHWPGQQNVSANGYTRSLCILDVPEDDTFDHRLANATIDSLRLAKRQQRPFAIFAGHRRPHVPWRLPTKWWDLYADREVAPPTQPQVYADAPNVAFTCGDQCEWVLWKEGRPASQAGQNPLTAATFANYSRGLPLDATFASSLRRAYYAAISLMDDSIGRTLAVLEELHLEKDTVIIFHADHGWGLGEGNLWHKFTNYEHSVRVPLIVKVPWIKNLAGSVISAPVELVDIYPSAAALTHSGTPSNASALDGVDFTPVLLAAAAANTEAGNASVAIRRAWQQRTHTFSDFPRCGEEQLPSDPAEWPTSAYEKNYCKSSSASDIFAMGYSLRSENMRYTRWMRWNGTTLAVHEDGWLDDSAATSSLLGEELYDHTGDDGTDFDKFPIGHANLAGRPTMEAQLKTHRQILASFFRDKNEAVAFMDFSKQ